MHPWLYPPSPQPPILAQDDLTLWELRAWTILQNYEEEERRGGNGTAADKKALNAYLCFFYGADLADQCQAADLGVWVWCARLPVPDTKKVCLDLLGLREMTTPQRQRLHQQHLLELDQCLTGALPEATCNKYRKAGPGQWSKLEL